MIIKLTESDLAQLQKDGKITLELDGFLSFCKAFDLYCRHNDAPYPQIYDLRKAPHWFEVVKTSNSDLAVGDKILVSRGYISNTTQGWIYDPLENRVTCGPSYGGFDWIQWPDNRCVCYIDVYVKRIDT